MTDVSATINGISVHSLRIEQDICRLAATWEGTTETFTDEPGDELVIYVNGTKRLTGYITNVTKSTDGTYTIQGTDKMILALDTFIIDEVRVEEELDAGYWVEYWLDYVGLTSSGSVETGRTVPPTLPDENGWQYISVGDILLECLAYAGGYVIYADADGVIQVVPMAAGMQGPSYNYISYSRTLDNSWYRNRAVIFGTTSGSWDDDVWVPGEFTVVAEYPEEEPSRARTTAVVSSYIQSQSAAEDLARDVIVFFSDNLDIRRYLIPDAGVVLGDGVTSIETTVNDAGVRQLVSTGEKCGFIWGAGKPYGQIAFIVEGILSTGDIGIWFYNDVSDGLTLRNTYSGVKTAPDGDDIEIYVQTSTNGTDWTTQHTNIISDGNKLSGRCETFTDDFVEEDTLVRFNIAQVGSDIAGEDLTFSVGIKVGEM